MNAYFVAAAATAFVVGLVHSVLGEKLIFQRLRQGGGLVPTNGGNVLAIVPNLFIPQTSEVWIRVIGV